MVRSPRVLTVSMQNTYSFAEMYIPKKRMEWSFDLLGIQSLLLKRRTHLETFFS